MLLFVMILVVGFVAASGLDQKHGQVVDCENKNGFYSQVSNICYLHLTSIDKSKFPVINEACRAMTPPSHRYHNGTLPRVSMKIEVDAIDNVRTWVDSKHHDHDFYLDLKRCGPMAEDKDHHTLKTTDWCLSDASGAADTASHIEFEISGWHDVSQNWSTTYEVKNDDGNKNCIKVDPKDDKTIMTDVDCKSNLWPICQFTWNECTSDPCQHAGTCTENVNMFTCTCVAGWTDLLCSTNINECASSPCQNAGACNDKINMYTCTCVAGYTDVHCETNIDECASNPCDNGATCNDGVNGFTCSCAHGWTDVLCSTNIDECASNPCQNGATCIDKVNGYVCICVAGYTDVLCQTNIDECASYPCQHGATCNDQINKYNCTCAPGYVHVHCETNFDECASNPCHNGGTCHDQVNGYECKCVAGFFGPICATEIDECFSNPCQNGATCNQLINKWTCTCVPGFTGISCSTNINECASSPCKHGSICHDGVNQFSCACPDPSASGEFCQAKYKKYPGYIGKCSVTLNNCGNVYASLPEPRDSGACACACAKNSQCRSAIYSPLKEYCAFLSTTKEIEDSRGFMVRNENILQLPVDEAVKSGLTYYENIICQ